MITHDPLDLTLQGSSPTPVTPHQGMFKPVHYEACKVGKQAVGFLLECFLVAHNFELNSLKFRTDWFDLQCQSNLMNAFWCFRVTIQWKEMI